MRRLRLQTLITRTAILRRLRAASCQANEEFTPDQLVSFGPLPDLVQETFLHNRVLLLRDNEGFKETFHADNGNSFAP